MNQRFRSGLLQEYSQPPKKIALVRASRIGDFLCAVPAIRALRNALPESEITLIALPFIRELVRRCPYIDRFREFPGFPGIAEQFFEPRRTLRFFRFLQSSGFDLAIQMHGSGVYANPFTLMLGAQITAGFVRNKEWHDCLDCAYTIPQDGHEIDRVLSLIRFLGASYQGDHLEFPLWQKDRMTAEKLLSGTSTPLIGLHPGAREAEKCFSPHLFASVGEELQRRYGGIIIILAGADERKLGEQIVRQIPGPAISLAGKTSLSTLGAIIDRLSVLVTNDSGPAHIAYARCTPTVTLFRTTDPARWGPLESNRHRVIQASQPSFIPTNQTSFLQWEIAYDVDWLHVVDSANEIFRKPSTSAGPI